MTLHHVLAVFALALLLGCGAAAPPQELLDAQVAYLKASSGPAAQVVPDELHKAKAALNAAEHAFAADPHGRRARDLAYIASRKAALAAAKAELALAQRERAEAEDQYTRTLARLQRRTQRQLEATRRSGEAQLQQEKAAASAKLAAEKAAASAKLAAEQTARAEAERTAQAALQDLAKVARLREEERGLVISLAGDILFVSGEASLLPTAQLRLNQLADALKETPQRLIIEGHTDSRGADWFNQDLSYRRAAAVRDFLVGRGLPGERIQVLGLGESRPVADNRTAEGRALNRRVEIILEGKHSAAR